MANKSVHRTKPRIAPEQLTQLVNMTLHARGYHVPNLGIIGSLHEACVVVGHYLSVDDTAAALQRSKSYVAVTLSQHRTKHELAPHAWLLRCAEARAAGKAAFAARAGKPSITQHRGAERESAAPVLPDVPELTDEQIAEADAFVDHVGEVLDREDAEFRSVLRTADDQTRRAMLIERPTPHRGGWWG